MLQKNDIELFVRKTLGCTCPDEVFEHIDCRADFSLPGGITLDYRINIGGRLLIYALSIDSSDSAAAILPQLVSAGIEERNKSGFNRFRLVLLTENPDRLAGKVLDLFNSLPTDDKTHLHLIAKDDFPTRTY